MRIIPHDFPCFPLICPRMNVGGLHYKKEENGVLDMENSYRFFENRECRYFPCHKGLEDFNCLFCYCPLYSRENCAGNPRFLEKNRKKIKDCTHCSFPHKPENYEAVVRILKEN